MRCRKPEADTHPGGDAPGEPSSPLGTSTREGWQGCKKGLQVLTTGGPFLTRTLARGHLQLSIPVPQMRSGLPNYVPPSAHDWGQCFTFAGQICSPRGAFTSGLWKCERIPQKTCSASRDPKLCSITFHVIASCTLWALLCPVRPGRVFKILRQQGCILDKPTRRRKAAKAKGDNSMLLSAPKEASDLQSRENVTSLRRSE